MPSRSSHLPSLLPQVLRAATQLQVLQLSWEIVRQEELAALRCLTHLRLCLVDSEEDQQRRALQEAGELPMAVSIATEKLCLGGLSKLVAGGGGEPP